MSGYGRHALAAERPRQNDPRRCRGDWEAADGLPCEAPEAECVELIDCGSGEGASLSCVSGKWSCDANETDCGAGGGGAGGASDGGQDGAP